MIKNGAVCRRRYYCVLAAQLISHSVKSIGQRRIEELEERVLGRHSTLRSVHRRQASRRNQHPCFVTLIRLVGNGIAIIIGIVILRQHPWVLSAVNCCGASADIAGRSQSKIDGWKRPTHPVRRIGGNKLHAGVQRDSERVNVPKSTIKTRVCREVVIFFDASNASNRDRSPVLVFSLASTELGCNPKYATTGFWKSVATLGSAMVKACGLPPGPVTVPPRRW